MRERLDDALKLAMRNRNTVAISTLQLIRAALKDRDIAARTNEGNANVRPRHMNMLQTMVKQRRESANLSKCGRDDLVKQETAEIEIITQFLPTLMSDAEMETAIANAIEKSAAVKRYGPSHANLRQDYAGRMDFSKAAAATKAKLA